MVGVTTPPSAMRRARTPDTPRWGYDDNYEPYPATRAATRRLQAAQTPAPATPRVRRTAPSTMITLASGQKVPRPVYTGTASSGPEFTPPTTVAKKRTVKLANLDEDLTAVVDAREPSMSPVRQHAGPSSRADMLSTPARTPQKKKINKVEGLSSVSRSLFSARTVNADEAMPSPRKNNKYADVLAPADDGSISIYTDSKDRVPEKDNAIDNPFYGEGRKVAVRESKRATKRRVSVTEPSSMTTEVTETKSDADKGAYYML